ncbi:DUF6508 domain-containing protein [uncultured Brachyspira sp.]|uniref:DUF6508 domain-containing protein n=1 Tax=uncultured Brachyspira sp. TaxID=221953 RepID=UPI00259B741D|nr:DUF6508 domain-containing protein [uncultured Brachyspira sp.]
MGRFEILTKHIEPLKNEKEYSYLENFDGERITKEEDLYYYDKNNRKVFIIPYHGYADTVNSFADDFYNFIEKNRDILRNKNKKICWRNCIEKIYLLDAPTIISLLHEIMVLERFSGGFFSAELKSGSILKLLERLKEIDESQN